MIAVSEPTANALNKSISLSMVNGCTIEYNMNDLILNTAVTASEGALSVSRTDGKGNTYKPFEKLFPLTSIIDPRRPKLSGIQYMILGDPSVSANVLASGSADAKTYASTKTLSSRLYFSGLKSAYKYWVSPPAAGMLLSNCILSVSYPANKTAATNKIVIKFETSHSKPSAWTLKLLNLAGAETPIYTGTAAQIVDGVITLYHHGGDNWLIVEPTNHSAGVDLSGLKLQVTSVDKSGGYLGIIEISARLVKDVTDILESFDISQNSSDNVNGLVPVGDVTANSLRLSLNSYDKSYEHYDKSNAFNKAKLNLYKNIIIRPSVTIESEKIPLGVFYLDSYEVDEFGEVSINALDGARELQYIKPPDIVTKDMSSVAIIRRLLDSVGFTNYNFNEADSSTVTPFYWYTDPKKTVWQHLQDLCKDTQMIAVFDNKDVLQFYPRGYVFNKTKLPSFSFRYDGNAVGLANISSIAIENVPSVKAIKVLYSPQLTSNYDRDADNLYTSPVMILGAGALEETLGPPPTPTVAIPKPDLGVLKLSPVQISSSAKQLYSYTGYLVLGKEIIEYDAIQYVYMPVIPAADGKPVYMWVTSEADVQANQALALPNTFAPTNQYRIKTRNAFGAVSPTDTDSLTHSADLSALRVGWEGKNWNPVTGNFTPNNLAFNLDDVVMKGPDGKDLENKDNLFYPIPRSMMTIKAPVVTSAPNADPDITDYFNNKTDWRIATKEAKYAKADGTASDNFIIGTSMYFPLLKNPTNNRATGAQRTIAGVAFALSADNKSGYYLSIATSQNQNGEKGFREIEFWKIKAGKLIRMTDSQKDTDGSIITGLNGGKLYKIDIRGNYSAPTVAAGQPTPSKVLTLRIAINNQSFVVVDLGDTDPIPTITQKVGLVSQQGVAAFDYIYTSPLTIEEFTANDNFDPYKGFLGGTNSIVKTFADFLFNQTSKQVSQTWIAEFGPVARELKRIQSRYTTPGFPLYPKLVNNSDVTIAGTSIDSFTMDVYVLNNTGTFTALANEDEKQFVIVGNSIVPSDSFEYVDPDLTDAEKQEMIGFDSTWIQRESEAKELSKWMTGQWSRQQRVITLQTFLNPIIQIGDVVQISYPNNKIYSEEDILPAGYSRSKYVVLAIDSAYDKDSPPTTSITCRSIYT